MSLSPGLSCCWVYYMTSQLPPTAQRCEMFLKIFDVLNKAAIWVHPIISSKPRYSCQFYYYYYCHYYFYWKFTQLLLVLKLVPSWVPDNKKLPKEAYGHPLFSSLLYISSTFQSIRADPNAHRWISSTLAVVVLVLLPVSYTHLTLPTKLEV